MWAVEQQIMQSYLYHSELPDNDRHETYVRWKSGGGALICTDAASHVRLTLWLAY